MNKNEIDSDPLTKLLQSRALAWLVILLGIFLRLRRYLLDRGVMHDEALLAANVLTKSFGELLKPLDLGDQAAPVGFLFLQKTSTLIFGPGEHAIRLVPFLAAIAALPLFYVLTCRLLGKPAALLAVSWMALAEPLIRYAAEGKQYSTDVFWTLLVLNLGLGPITRRSAIILGIVGAIAIWFCHPVIFVLGGLGAAILLTNLSHRKNAVAITMVGIIWITSFGINFLTITRHYVKSDYLTNYWANLNAFAPLHLHARGDLLWYPRALVEAMEYPVGLSPGSGHASFIAVMAAIAFLAGSICLRRNNRTAFYTILMALLLSLIASGLRKYPFAERLLLFATPLFILPIAVVCAANWFWPARALLLAILFIYPTYMAAQYFRHPHYSYDIKPAILYVRAHYQPGDTVYLHYGSDKLGHFYFDTEHVSPPGLQMISGPFEPNMASRASTFADDVAKLSGKSRVWFIFSMDPGQDRKIYESLLNNRARPIDIHAYEGGAAELYDFGR